MKTLRKKILTVCLALVMAFATSVPAFADWTLKPDNDSSKNYLNIKRYDSHTEMNGCPLILLYVSSPGFDQNFTVDYNYYNGKACVYYTRSERGITYAINRSSSTYSSGRHMAIMWTLSSGKTDSAFQRPYSDPNGLVNLLNYSESMSYSSDTSGALVYFTPGLGSEWSANGTPPI